MSGILMAMLGGQGFRVLGASFASDITGVGITTAPQVRMEPDASALLHQADGSYAASAWGDPIIPAIGTGYWVKANLGAGSAALTGDVAGSWLQLNVERVWSIAAASPGSVATRTLSYEIATDGAGANVVASGTITLTSDRT